MLKKTGWTGFGNRCDRFWLSMHKSRGVCFGSGGVAYVYGELFCEFCLGFFGGLLFP
jgi:hypothetical protein